MNDGLRVPELFHHLLDHADDYRAIVVSPVPVLDDVRLSARSPPSARSCGPACTTSPTPASSSSSRCSPASAGVWFQTEPELELLPTASARPPAQTARRRRGRRPCPSGYDPDGFRRPPRPGDGPFVLYAGRREGAKGWEGLLDGFAEAVRKEDLDLHLVTFGVGRGRPARRRRRPGRRPRLRRRRATATTPSPRPPPTSSRRPCESFSRTVMEAWLAGTLVIANGASDVVRWHCERSGAGLLYDDDAELEQCLRFVAEAPDAGRRPGQARPRLRARPLHLAGHARPHGGHPRRVVPGMTPDRERPRAHPGRRAVPAVARRDRHLRRAAGAAAAGRRATTSRCCSPSPVGRPPPPRPAGPGRRRRAGRLVPRLRPGHRPLPPRRLLPAAVHRRARASHRGPGARRRLPGRPATSSVRLHEFDHRWGDRARPVVAGPPAGCCAGADQRHRPHRPSSATSWSTASACRPTGSSSSTTAPTSCRAPPPTGRTARAALGLPADEHVFLCIGFVQPHKGFDRAVRAFAGLAAQGARLDVVGSVAGRRPARPPTTSPSCGRLAARESPASTSTSGS